MDRRLVLFDRGFTQKLALTNEKMDAGFNRLDAGFSRLESLLMSVVETQTHINGDLSDKVSNHEERITNLEKKA